MYEMELNIKSINKVCYSKDLLNDSRKNLNKQRKDGKYCDYILKSSDGGLFIVHKCILQSSCLYFENLFNTDISERFDNESDSNIQNIRDLTLFDYITSEILEKCIEFIYVGEINVSTQNAKQLLDAARRLHLHPLIETCIEVLIESVQTSNCLDLLKYSEYYHLNDDLNSKCIAIFYKNLNEISDYPGFCDLSENTILKILSVQRDASCEELLYLLIMKWINFNISERGEAITRLMNKISFENISVEFGIDKIITDSQMLENKYFTKKLIDILKINWKNFEKFSKDQSVIFNPEQLNKNLCKLHVIIGNDMILFDNNINKNSFSKIETKLNDFKQNFAFSTFGEKNFFIFGGRNKRDISKSCYNYIKSNDNIEDGSEIKWLRQKLPSMFNPRFDHRAITLENKIYVCGGDREKSVEIFDVEKSIWLHGPSFSAVMDKIGLCYYDSSIYALAINYVERHDPRENGWKRLSSNNRKSIHAGISHGYYIYGFSKDAVLTFDVRNNIWLNNDLSYDIQYKSPNLFVDKFNNEIYLFGQSTNNKYTMHLYNTSDLTEFNSYTFNLPREDDCYALFSL